MPIDFPELEMFALKTRVYAKALRYRELAILNKFDQPLLDEDCEALIKWAIFKWIFIDLLGNLWFSFSLANKLQLKEEAVGVIAYASEKKISLQSSQKVS